MNQIGIIFALTGITLLQGLNFYLLVNRRIKFFEAFRLVSVAAAFNRILLTGTGYVAGSLFSRNKQLPFYQALGAFLISELLFVGLWLILGLLYGVRLAQEMPWLFLLLPLTAAGLLLLKKEKIAAAGKNLLGYLVEAKRVIPAVLLCNTLNAGLFIFYYYLLFGIFDFYPGYFTVLKIVSITITLSYFSPLPSGLGIKEGALGLLLMEAGQPLGQSLAIALADRIILTSFWFALGSLLGFDLIKEELARRFCKKTEDNLTKNRKMTMIKRLVSTLIMITPRPIRRFLKKLGADRVVDKVLDKHDAELIFQKKWVKEFQANPEKASVFWEQHRYLSEIKDICGIGPESKVFDLGCGISSVLHYLEGDRHGIDPLAEEYKTIYAYPGSMKIQKGSGEETPFVDDFFDVVFCTNVLDHVSDPLKTVTEIHRVLKKSGFFVLVIEVFTEKIDRGLEHPHSFTDAEVEGLMADRFSKVFDREDVSAGLRGFMIEATDELHHDRIMVLKKN
ncbi:MAG: hypothetical protein A2521_13280 [Deltaproteobacteria bacterium RIFOXYD12_FULL_57_12]|nr:MAG: hypothetical protein A2521_13280 [Deltaproteobacteria bacterium RIFOXYD12_FULL_57_12]